MKAKALVSGWRDELFYLIGAYPIYMHSLLQFKLKFSRGGSQLFGNNLQSKIDDNILSYVSVWRRVRGLRWDLKSP